VRLPDLGDRAQGWVWIQAALMAAIPIVGGLAPGWPAPARGPAIVTGSLLVVAGCALLLLGIVGLGDSFAVFPAPATSAELVTSGIYARARHPIYGGWIVVGIGFAVALSPWALPLTILLAAQLWGKSEVEERRLLARYPAYGAYRARVRRRFLPVTAMSRRAGRVASVR
jgi:protein-S-isoprenylcysteine O-methyltransferase Ste14